MKTEMTQATLKAKKEEMSPSTSLRLRLMKLNSLKEEKEGSIKRHLKEIGYSLKPAAIIKSTVSDLKEDKEFKSRLLENAIGTGTDFLLQALIFRRGIGVKKYLFNLGLKKIIALVIRNKKIFNPK